MIKTYDFRTKEQKRADRKAARKAWIDSKIGWIRENKDVLVFVVPGMITVLSCGTKCFTKVMANHTLNKEIQFKERTIYDHSLGRYVELKRPLTAAQALSIEERRAGGERLHTILNDMGLLKR